VDAPERIRVGVEAPDLIPEVPTGFLGERSTAPTLTPGPAASTPPFALCLSAPRRPNSVGVFLPPGANVPPAAPGRLEPDSPPPPRAAKLPLAGDGSLLRDLFIMLEKVPDLDTPSRTTPPPTPTPAPLGTDLESESTGATADESNAPAELVRDSERRFRSCLRFNAVSFWPVSALLLLGESGEFGAATARRPAIGGDLDRTGAAPA
tara:strand:+ start:4667 stop:5287 length:621 start_codon:yes stop_codon:yes gene_type:complete